LSCERQDTKLCKCGPILWTFSTYRDTEISTVVVADGADARAVEGIKQRIIITGTDDIHTTHLGMAALHRRTQCGLVDLPSATKKAQRTLCFRIIFTHVAFFMTAARFYIKYLHIPAITRSLVHRVEELDSVGFRPVKMRTFMRCGLDIHTYAE
jgi:hypothetical protein